jgi:hypothetical protein
VPYQLIRDAIRDRACLTAHYEHYIRYFSPNALGKDSRHAPVVVTYQYGGGRPGGLPRGGDWACFDIAELSNLRRNADKWTGGRFTSPKPLHVLKYVDIAA